MFSNSAPFLSLLAPGFDINSSIPGGGFDEEIGTSYAVPHVAGAWAILKQRNSTATVGQILNALQTTGVKITDTREGANNRVNCLIQIDQAVSNIPEPFVTLSIAESYASGINNCGQIVGTRYVGWSAIGFLSNTKNEHTDIIYAGPLEPEGGVWDTFAAGINNKGEITGSYCCGYYGDRGFWRNASGTYTQDTYPGSNTNDSSGNNDLGDSVGSAFIYSLGSDVGYILRGSSGQQTGEDVPSDINNQGRIAGEYQFQVYPVRHEGIYYDSVGRQTFRYPNAYTTNIAGINESGQIVGCASDETGWITYGFLRNPDGTVNDINYPGMTWTCAAGINDSRQIVGTYWDDNWAAHGFVDLSW